MGNRWQEFSDILRSKHPVLGQMPSVLQPRDMGGWRWGITTGFNYEKENAQLLFGFSVFVVKHRTRLTFDTGSQVPR